MVDVDCQWTLLMLVEGAWGKLLRLQNMCATSMYCLQALEASLGIIKNRMSEVVCMLSYLYVLSYSSWQRSAIQLIQRHRNKPYAHVYAELAHGAASPSFGLHQWRCCVSCWSRYAICARSYLPVCLLNQMVVYNSKDVCMHCGELLYVKICHTFSHLCLLRKSDVTMWVLFAAE